MVHTRGMGVNDAMIIVLLLPPVVVAVVAVVVAVVAEAVVAASVMAVVAHCRARPGRRPHPSSSSSNVDPRWQRWQ